MSDTKVYQFGETGSGTLNSLLPLLQQRGIDPAYIAGLANNNNGGFFGGNAWEGIIALIIVAAIFDNIDDNTPCQSCTLRMLMYSILDQYEQNDTAISTK